MEKLKALGDLYAAFEYFLETVVLLKRSNNMRPNDPEQQQKIMEFCETYCSYCSDGTEVVKLIHDFKVVERFGDYGRKKKRSSFIKW